MSRAAEFSHMAGEDFGSSPSKRHLGSGGDIHLKLLIPRYCWHSETMALDVYSTDLTPPAM